MMNGLVNVTSSVLRRVIVDLVRVAVDTVCMICCVLGMVVLWYVMDCDYCCGDVACGYCSACSDLMIDVSCTVCPWFRIMLGAGCSSPCDVAPW